MSIFYSEDLKLRNVSAMVTDNTNLYLVNIYDIGTPTPTIFSIPISSHNMSTLLYSNDNNYYINSSIAYYNNYIYFTTNTSVCIYSILTKVTTTKLSNTNIIYSNLCINSVNGNVYFTQSADVNANTSRLLIYNSDINAQITIGNNIYAINNNNCASINVCKYNDSSVIFALGSSQIISITTDNTNVYLLVILKNPLGITSNLGPNTILVVFSNVNTNYWTQGVFYILDNTSQLYSKILYNNGFLYFTQNASYTTNNYIVKTDLTGNIINSTSYLGGNSIYGGGMTFDSNGNFYVTWDQYQNTPTKTSILATLVPPCFKSGTLILTNKGYFPVESLRSDDLIQTYKHGLVPIYKIGKKEMYHPAENSRIKSQLYRCSQDKYPELFEDLIITGCHSILVDSFESEEQRNKIIEVNNDTYGTDGKIRLPACVDDKTTVYEKEGTYTIYHFALENDNYYANYGVYANGLLVETCSKRYITELANMDIV